MFSPTSWIQRKLRHHPCRSFALIGRPLATASLRAKASLTARLYPRTVAAWPAAPLASRPVTVAQRARHACHRTTPICKDSP
ncbi:hypothetical protein [Lampropedia puyangensis]|uniref:hypothetical protein n=1 Tax=Lampropedia puyangensis TaxID=1330072 RepID=UPI0010A7B10A|nr:hypothetical protein [Lampropedia puyangensis]